MRGLLRSDRGSSMLEFALVLPVLLLLLIGLIDLGRAAYLGIQASNAARAGAQYGSQNISTVSDTAGMNTAIAADSPGVTWSTSASPRCSVNGGALTVCSTGGSAQNVVYYVKVHVSGQFTPLIRYPGIPSPINIGGDAVMRVTTQ